MPTLKLTSRALDTLPLPSRGRVEYFDESLPGFALRVFPSGRRVFALLYRMRGGRAKKKQRVDLGTYSPLTRATHDGGLALARGPLDSELWAPDGDTMALDALGGPWGRESRHRS